MKTESGMTLVEVLVAMLISTVIIISGYEVFHWASTLYSKNYKDFQNYSTLHNAAMWVIRDLRKSDAGSVSVSNGGQSLTIGSDVFNFSQNNLVKTTAGGNITVATGVTGNFSLLPAANGSVEVTVNIKHGANPQRYLQLSAVVYPVRTMQ
ncbi:MAG: prepilin-type N-terminal cleavage/methylation domain-containing protein [Peptococcaceae bacterium]|nr:prepilin-type N-terminal cleavage/methylation domain-containing protein [Peptococcaceae bacterium]